LHTTTGDASSDLHQGGNGIVPQAETATGRLLRHAAASLLSDAGVSLEDIADTLGHRSVTVTAEVYRHPLAPVRSGHLAAMSAFGSAPPEPLRALGSETGSGMAAAASRSPDHDLDT